MWFMLAGQPDWNRAATAAEVDGRSGATATQPTASATEQSAASAPTESVNETQNWNLHFQNTVIVQGDPAFHASYSGPHSLHRGGEIKETVSLDVYSGLRLWPGAELHADALVWQGFGLSHTFGIDDFPNGDAYKAGTRDPNVMFAHLFLRQTFGFGGEQEEVPDDQLTLAGRQDVSRLTLTIGRGTPLDIMDHNTYAGDPHRQFMNWANAANVTWDYGQDTIGYGTGFTAELNQRDWALRYVFFPMPLYQNHGNAGSGDSGDDQYLTYPQRGSYGKFLKSWAMALEYERRYTVHAHPGAIRFLAWLNESKMDSYDAAAAVLRAHGASADISVAEAYHYAYGFGLNWEQEITQDVGVFSRLGWNDGKSQALEFTDANWTASLGLSIKGRPWGRADDTLGLAGIVSGISRDNQKFLAAGGLGILDGDGALRYRPEMVIETFYDFQIVKNIHGAVDYQFINDPAFNRDRGPVSAIALRFHVEF